MNIGSRIKHRRELLGMSQEELAKKVGYKSRSSVNKIEIDGRGLPQSKIVAFANALETTPAYLMGWDEQQLIEELRAEPNTPKIMTFYEQLNDLGKHEAEKRVEELTYFPQYSANQVNAAHAIAGASKEEQQYDEDIMDDENF